MDCNPKIKLEVIEGGRVMKGDEGGRGREREGERKRGEIVGRGRVMKGDEGESHRQYE